MSMKSRGIEGWLGVLLGSAALGACASGGSGPPLASAPVELPPPPPAPPPAGGSFDTPEYRRSSAATQSNLLSVWNAGLTGAGVTVGIVDSGIAQASAEFAGRIHPASRDVTGANRGIGDEDGHGTAVAAVIGAARNGVSIVGIAPEARLAVMRGDRAGTCAAESGCKFTDSSVAAGVNAATDAGARVINISLGGSPGSATLRAAWQRATSAGAVLVIGAGNDSSAEVDPLPRSALNAGNSANIIVVGAANANRDIASFSNRAGSAASNFLLAPGQSIRTFVETGQEFLFSGTSLAAPAVSGAVALLAQAFPNLTGAQIVELLLRNADDLGAPGPDPIYGWGLLNIGRAFAPSGTTVLAGTRVAVSLVNNGALGAPMGPGAGFAAGIGDVGITDAYGRTYGLRIGDTLRAASPARLGPALLAASIQRSGLSLPAGRLALRLDGAVPRTLPGLAPGADIDAHLGLAQKGMGPFSGTASRFADGGVLVRAGPFQVAAGSGLAAPLLPGEGGADGLVARDALGFGAGRIAGRLSAGVAGGGFELAVARTVADAGAAAVAGLPTGVRVERTGMGMAFSRDRLRLGLTAGVEREDGAFLGSRLSPVFGLTGGSGRYLGVCADAILGPLDLRASALQGWHRAEAGGGLLAGSDGIETFAWSIHAGAPLGPGRLSLDVAGPQGVVAGAFDLAAGGKAGLALTAREVAVEAGYALGPLSLSAFVRNNAGHRAGLLDSGAAVRFQTRF
jgi:hypothetical protein